MNEPKRIAKVVAYIVRDRRVVVFKHLDVSMEQTGIQVPAGTVKRGERLQAATLREASEETGLRPLEIERYLGRRDYDIRPTRNEVHRRHFFQVGYYGGRTPTRWPSFETHDGTKDATSLECWWIPLHDAHVLAAGLGALIGRVSLASDE